MKDILDFTGINQYEALIAASVICSSCAIAAIKRGSEVEARYWAKAAATNAYAAHSFLGFWM